MTSTVVINGMGCVCAAGNNVEQIVDSMLSGERYVCSAPPFATSHPHPYPVFSVTSPLHDFGLPAEDIVYLRTALLGLNAAQQALDNSCWDMKSLRSLKVGVCIGTTVGSSMDVEKFYADYRSGKTPDMRPVNCFYDGNPATIISKYFAFNGPCQTIVNACSSGTDAIGTATMWLRSGMCDVVLAGGADELCRTTYNGFAALQISSPELCSPFSVERSGLNLGEGAAVMVLAREEIAAEFQGKESLGYILGYGSGTDAWHLTAPHPEGRGLKQALNEAFSNTVKNINDDAVDDNGAIVERLAFVNTHGTGTRDNDCVEGAVLSQLLPKVLFHSTKGYTGHTLGAAGAIEAVLTLAFLRRGQIPASAGFSTIDPEIERTPVTENTTISSDIALSESLAFGGNNAALVISLNRSASGVIS
ncbi:MAG: beta-ketoacyl synthase [Desulfobacteraceae bacterium 4572_35.1]|nr:MAG: beta-ketoacyl synthase [Desulfobacteraceae bacterium 4572_35.1]